MQKCVPAKEALTWFSLLMRSNSKGGNCWFLVIHWDQRESSNEFEIV